MIKKLNIGIIGMGIGEKHFTIYNNHKYCNVVSVCDFNSKKLNEVKKRLSNNKKIKFIKSADEIINDPSIDLVSVASYDNYHFNHVKKCILKGKHVFVEKPLCLKTKELNEIDKILNNNKKILLSSNFVLRTFSEFLKFKNYYLTNKLTKVYHLEGEYNYGRFEKIIKGWRGSIPFYSVTHGGGIHLIDLMLWITGFEVERVIATGNKISSKNSKFKYNDMVVALIKFKNGATAKISSNFSSITSHHHVLKIFSTKNTYIYDFKGAYEFKSRKEIKPRKIKNESGKKEYILNSFINKIIFNKNSKYLVSAKNTINVMKISLAIEKSLKSNAWEKVL